MSEEIAHLCGAWISPEQTDAVCLALAAQGAEPLFGDAAPQFNGYGEGKCVLLQDAEEKLFGHTLPSWMQTRGTCVSQGTGRGVQDSLYNDLAFGDAIGKPVQLSAETIYGGSRVQVGKGQMGKASPWGSSRPSGDGSCGAWAAQFVHDYGMLARGVYGSIDLSKAREDLSIQWGNVGVPQALLQESAGYKARACMRAMTVENVRDGLAAGYAGARCAQKATHGQRDQDGMLQPSDSGGHCQELCGVFVDYKGRLCFVEQQSWGAEAGPVGGGMWKLQDGREVQPREGACGIFVDSIQTYLRTGEIWLFAPPKTVWADATITPSRLA